MCPLYPGMRCSDHVDAAVDVDNARDDGLVKVPFIELCPNSWLVPPVGDPVQIPEADQFVVAKVKANTKKLQTTLGDTLGKDAFREIRNALANADTLIDDEKWAESLKALAGIEKHAKKPHAALTNLITLRLEDVEEQVGWEFEDATTEGHEDETTDAERVAAVKKLVEAIDVGVYGKKLALLETMQAWLKKQ